MGNRLASGTRDAGDFLSTSKFGLFGGRVVDSDLDGWESILQFNGGSVRAFFGGKGRFRVAVHNDCETVERKVVQALMHVMKSPKARELA